MVARATPLKGGERFVRIVAAAGKRGIIVGDGPALSRWKGLAESVGAEVRFTGAVSHSRAMAHIASMEVLLLLPRTHEDGSGAEGAGLVLLEAASLGVPGVGCRTGGVPEALGPGLILEDPDDAAASAVAIRAWISPDRGRRAREWLAANHGKARLARALRDISTPVDAPLSGGSDECE
jgi:glycosyltransferase involved in cell wall biosynthesis